METATSKAALIELCNRNYPNVEPQVVEAAIGKAFNMLFYGTFRKDLSNLDLYAKTYTEIPVAKDTNTDTYYSLLPIQTVQLPDPSEGVRRVYLKKGVAQRKFVPLQKSAWSLNLIVFHTVSWVAFCVKPDRIEYHKDPECTSVSMDLVIPFELMDEDDPVYIPSGQDETLLQLVGQFLTGTPPVDKTNK